VLGKVRVANIATCVLGKVRVATSVFLQASSKLQQSQGEVKDVPILPQVQLEYASVHVYPDTGSLNNNLYV
jgi:hypothetical protein